MRALEHGDAERALRARRRSPGSHLRSVAAAVEADLRLGRRRSATRASRRAAPSTASPPRRRGARGRARRWSARVRDRASGRAPPALPSPRPCAPRQGGEVLAGDETSSFGPDRAAGSAGSTASPCSPTARACSPTTRSTRPRSGCSPSPGPIWSSPTTPSPAWRRRPASRSWPSPTSTRSALAVAAWQGRAVRIVPLDDRRPPAAYAGLLDLLEDRSTSAELDPFTASRDDRQKPARSCSFATRAARAYAHPAESGGYGRGEPVAQSFATARFLTVQEVADLCECRR